MRRLTHRQAVEMGRKGGLKGGRVRNRRKAQAVRANGALGGRPRRLPEITLERWEP